MATMKRKPASKAIEVIVISPDVMRAHAAELRSYKTGKGSFRFAPGQLPPAALITKLVKARIAENEANASD